MSHRKILGAVGVKAASCSVAWLALTATAVAQPRPIRLKPADRIFEVELNRVGSVRELSDFRILVADEGDQRILVLDPRSNRIEILGRLGSGPGEYRMVSRLLAIADDSTLMYDINSSRWLVFHRDRIVRTVAANSQRLLWPSGPLAADKLGNVLAIPLKWPDSMSVLLVDRTSGRATTLRRLAPANPRYMPVALGPGSPRGQQRYNVQILDPDQATLFGDGQVAIAHPSPFVVDWCSPKKCESHQIGRESPPLSDADKKGFLRIAALTSGWPPTQSIERTTGWPEKVPAFIKPTSLRTGSALLAMPDGSLLVHRFFPRDTSANNYDLINRQGQVVSRLRIALSERIVGFGARWVYVVATDTDGVEQLRRHPWP